jgi:hypothetical protein
LEGKKRNIREVLKMTSIDKIIAYEQGNLNDEGILELFQELVDNGMAWTLQGHYGRTAKSLVDAGLVILTKKGD